MSVASSMSPRWTRVSTSGPAVFGHACAYSGGAVWLYGGEDERHRPCASLWRLDPSAGAAWEEVHPEGDPPGPRDGHALVAVGDDLWLVGGSDGAGCAAGVHVLRGAAGGGRPRWEEARLAGEPPAPRTRHTAVRVALPGGGGDSVLVTGGWNTEEAFADARVLDAGAMRWREAGWRGEAPPVRVWAATAADAGGAAAVLHAGEDAGTYLHGGMRRISVVEAADGGGRVLLEAAEERYESPAPPDRYGHAFVAAPGGAAAVLFGGYGGEMSLLADAYRYSFRRREWSPLGGGNGPSGRFGHTATLAGGGRLVVHGGQNASMQKLSDTWVLELGDAFGDDDAWAARGGGGDAPPAEEWACGICTLLNSPFSSSCVACGSGRP